MQLTLAATSKQIMISYTAPDTNVCTVEVSESPSYLPVVNDVNASLFAGSNLDSRIGSLGAGTTGRTFLAGTAPDLKGVLGNLASDGNRYGRLLQPGGVTHYVRVTCGATVATGSITTKNRPLGMTRADEQPLAAAGTYAFPNINTTDRSQTIIDPATGILLRKMSQPNEDVDGGETQFYGSGAPWPFAQATIHDSHGTPGYLGMLPTSGGASRLYFVTETSSRFLGKIIQSSLPGFPTGYMACLAGGAKFGPDPTQLFSIMEDSNGDEHVVLCQLPSSGDTYYDQSVVPNTNASCVWSDRTPNPNNLALLVYNFVHNFDPSYDFDKTKFSIGSQQWMQGNYLCHVDFRGNQDTYAWIGAVDTSTNPATVTGQMLQCRGGALSGAESSRWCAVHTSHPVLGAPPKMSWTAKTPNGSNVTLWQTTITGAITSSQLTVTFATNTPLDVTTGDTPPYSIQSGDEVYFDPQTGNQEIAILGSNVSGTTWNIAARGVAGTTAKAHADGSAMQMGCRSHRPSDATAVGPNWWDFVNDPHGVDRTGTYYIAQLANVATYAGHEGFANGTGIAEGGWYEFIGPAMVNNTVFFNSDSPTFAGAAKNGSGDSWQKHAGAAQQSNATGAQGGYNWGSEFFVLDQDIELKPTSLTNITGTLWKWVNTNYTLSRKNLAMMALSGTHPLLDVSSTATGNVIGGLAADNYKYCVANAVNECRTGSAIGDIYINSPGIIGGSTCPGGSGSWTDETILCFGHPPAFGGAVLQLGVIAADGTGRYNRSLTQGLIPFKSNNQSADAHTTPDGRWTVYPYRIGWGDTALSGMWLARVPPWSGYDGINRNTFIQKTVTLGGPAASVTAITEFGYDTNLYCTSRNEVCVSAQANNPYFFASESYTRISCPSGVCTNTIPVIPDRTAYYRHKFYDSGGNLINTSDLFLLAEDSAPVVGGGPAAVISGQVVVSGPVTII